MASAMRIMVFLILGLAGMVGLAGAQPGWTWKQIKPSTSPMGLVGHAMAFDPVRKVTVLFGGYDGNQGYRSETWEWDGSTWNQRAPNVSPSGRMNHAMVFDYSRSRVILFGGLANYKPGIGPSVCDETWEWDGINWSQLQLTTRPESRQYHSMISDPTRKEVILFGGQNVSAALADTWRWDGKKWVQLTPPASPPARYWHSMAYDSVRNKAIIFGGYDFPAGRLADTWEWDGQNWVLLQPIVSPKARYQGAMSFNVSLGKTFLFGGSVYESVQDDTWAWDGVNWEQLKPYFLPGAHARHAMAYDSIREKTVIYGGALGLPSKDTWEYVHDPGVVTPIGNGCQGSQGKAMVLSSAEVPRLGASFHLDLVNAPPLTGSGLFLDVVNPSIDLGSFGAPGCFAYTNLGLFHLVIPVTWSGTWYPSPNFKVPNNLALLGGVFYAQAFALDAKANALGWITSNGLKGKVGF